MNEQPEVREPEPPMPGAKSASILSEIKGSAISLLIGGGICLYLGFAFVADAPGSVSKEEAEHWFARDNAFFWCLRATGVLFLVAAGLAAGGRRVAMLLAALVETVFTLLAVAMSVEWTIEARMDGQWNYQVILLVILAILSAGGAKRSWELYRAAGGAARVGLHRDKGPPK